MEYKLLSEITTKIGSGATPKGGNSAYQNSGISLIRSQNVLDFKFSKDGLAFINKEQAAKLNNVTVQKDDVLLNITGDSIARTCIIPDEILPARVNQHVSIIRCKPAYNPRYIHYYLMNMKPYLLQICGVGGTRNALTKEALLKLPIKISPQQNEIAKVLSDLDAKIELNNKINAELEAMAKTFYDYWFVQFDFPDANGKPYKTSGGKMVYNEELKREIPEGWKVKKTEEIVYDIKTGLNPREHFKLGGGLNYYITIKNIEYGRISFDNSCDRIDDEAMERIQKRSNLEKGDILFTSIEPVGKTYLLLEKPTNWNINESVFSFKPNYDLVSSEYLFMLLSSKVFNDLCKNASTGSIHKGIRITPMKAFKNCYPNNKILIDEFTKIVSPYLKLIDKNQKENQELVSLRDWLLPMLMNGQVSVASTGSATEKRYEVEDSELGMVAEDKVEYKKN